MSTPLVSGSNLVGVLTVYSSQKEAFTDDHRRIIEAVARQVSKTLQASLQFESEKASALFDQLTGLPTLARVSKLVDAELGAVSPTASLSIISVDLSNTDTSDESAELREIVTAIKATLRGADVLFRHSEEELVALLIHTDNAAAAAVADRVRVRIQETGLAGLTGAFIGFATAPDDGATLDSLLGAARSRRSKRGWQRHSARIH
jgi:GGDEF domain-containing protein